MTKTYNTVKTVKLVDEDEDNAARRAIDACQFLTPETEADIDLALGFGTTSPEPVTVDVADEIVDIMDAAGPSDEALVAIEAEQESVDAPR